MGSLLPPARGKVEDFCYLLRFIFKLGYHGTETILLICIHVKKKYNEHIFLHRSDAVSI